MNPYGIAILTTLLVSYGLDLISQLLNLKALREELPPEFEGLCDAEEYRRSQEYTRVGTRFELFRDSFDLSILLAFWMSGGFAVLDAFVRDWTDDWPGGDVSTGLVYIGVLLGARMVLGLPFSLYSTFVIEERFGFNKTTLRTFVADRIKGVVLAAVLGGPLLGLLLLLLEGSELAWIYCWISVTAFGLLVQLILPAWILPLFHRFEPLQEGELREAILGYARSVRFPIEKIFVIDGSRRSSKSNAFFTGVGREKRLALFDTLVARHTVPELVAVVAHEVGHYKRRHVLKGMALGALHSGLLFFLLSIFMRHDGLFEAFFVEETSVYAGLVFFGLLYSPIELLLSIAFQAYSRKNEYEADRFAAETIADAEAMAVALKKLSVDNLSNLTPHPFHVFLHHSHPPVLARIGAIGKTEK